MLVLKNIHLLKNTMHILYFALSFCLCKEIEMLMQILGGKMQSFLTGTLRRCLSLAGRFRRCSHLFLISLSFILVVK